MFRCVVSPALPAFAAAIESILACRSAGELIEYGSTSSHPTKLNATKTTAHKAHHISLVIFIKLNFDCIHFLKYSMQMFSICIARNSIEMDLTGTRLPARVGHLALFRRRF